jgi:hypothetical protein
MFPEPRLGIDIPCFRHDAQISNFTVNAIETSMKDMFDAESLDSRSVSQFKLIHSNAVLKIEEMT